MPTTHCGLGKELECPQSSLFSNYRRQGHLFDGLEEDEASFESDLFVPRHNVRKLVINNSSRLSTSARSHSPPSAGSRDLSDRDRSGIEANARSVYNVLLLFGTVLWLLLFSKGLAPFVFVGVPA